MRLGFRDNLQVVNDLAVAQVCDASFTGFCDFVAERVVILEARLNVAFSGWDCWSEEVAHDYLLLGCCAFLNAIAGP